MSQLSRKVTNILYSSVEKLGVWKLIRFLSPNTLTVLNYHRILPINSESKSLFLPNVSATPEMFCLQMAYLRENYNVVSLTDVVEWLNGGRSLQRNAALITFDDGYLDNYENAYPILAEYNFPAVIFLTTDFMDQKLMFFWDVVAYCISKTTQPVLDLPVIGKVNLEGENKNKIINALVNKIKYLNGEDRQAVVEAIQSMSGVPLAQDDFIAKAMTWDQAAEMASNGIEFGAHTVRHPILSKVDGDRAEFEISESKKRIEEILGTEVISFAYPNGQPGDFNAETLKIIENSDFQVAFSLISGVNSFKKIRQNRFALRRIFLSHKDSLPKFAAKLSGLAGLVKL